MAELSIARPAYPAVFAGLGFHNSEASMYRLMDERHFNETICKCYRELSPGFMRTFAGFSDWTKEAMDDFAEYYEKMQKRTDTPIYMTPGRGKLHFSDDEMRRYAEDVAERLSYLVNEKDVRHLAYYCFSNELGQVTGGRLKDDLPAFKRYHEHLYRAFQNAGLNIGLLATDAAQDWSSLDWAMQNMDVLTKDYCAHYYERDYAVDDPSFYDFWVEKCRAMTDKAVKKQKHFILGEFGSSTVNCKIFGAAVRDACSHFDDGETVKVCLKLSEMIIGAVNAGVFALAMWTFSDYPDPMNGPSFSDAYSSLWTRYEPFLGGGVNIRYNKWGLFRWEDDGDHSARAHYPCIGLLTKYLKRNAKVLETSSDDPLIRSCAVMNRDGSVSLALVSRKKEPVGLTLSLPARKRGYDKPFRVYEYDTNAPVLSPFADLPDPVLLCEAEDGVLRLTVRPESVLVVTDDYLVKTSPVTAEPAALENGRLSWRPVSDPNHCYYRVYFDGSQIASTVGTSLMLDGRAPEDASLSRFSVRSVDRSGNV